MMVGLAILIFIISINLVNCMQKPMTLLISFDGFRWNYLDRTDTPNFDELVRSGVKAEWVKTEFISVTFPNHYSIVTGLQEESHGMIANQFYDPAFKTQFDYHSSILVGESRWWGGEPIWITSEMQGKHAGVFFWVGSEAEIKGKRPSQWKTYDSSIDWTKRVDTVVEWLANKPHGKEQTKHNISLALLYFNQPDRDGHIFGPDSPEVTERIKKCDDIIGYLIEKLKEIAIYEDVNIIITSDHGMANLQNTIPILPRIDLNKVEILLNRGTWAGIWPKADHVEAIYQNLTGFHPHAKAWKKEDIPEEFYYKHNPRIPPILISPDVEWLLVNKTNDTLRLKGGHGYNNSHPDMYPIFIAHGPAFREGFVSHPFRSINIYELICHIMQLKPAPNNGSLDNVKHLLRSFDDKTTSGTKIGAGAIIGIFGGLCLLVVLVFFVVKRFTKRSRYTEALPLTDVDDVNMVDLA